MMPIRRPLRIASIAIAAVLVVGAGVVAVLVARIDPNSYKPQIIEAVKHATGRDLTLNGKISLKPSLWPTIQVEDAAFSNPPGFSRPRMAMLQGLELRLSLLPLLSSRIEIARLNLIRPDILLETDAAGHPNWQLTPEVSPAAPAGSQAPVKAGKTTMAISVQAIRIEDGTVAYRDDATGKVTTLGLSRLAADAASPDAPLHLDADASFNGTAFTLIGDTGSLSRLQDAAGTSSWPVKLTLTTVGAKLTADGAMTQPLTGKGYDLAVNGRIPDLAALTPLLQGYVPPPLHDVNFAAKVTDTGAALPALSALTLHVGASDLGAQWPGLTLSKLDISAAAADQPLKADVTGKLADQPIALLATTGPLAALMPGAKPTPFPVDARLEAAGATLTAKGTIADARALAGASIVVAAQIPDLSALSALAGRPLPPVKPLTAQGTLTDAAGGFRNGAALHGLTVASSAGDLSGDATVGLGARDSLSAALKSNHIDLDAWMSASAGSPPPAPPPSGSKPPPLPTREKARLFSDQPLPLQRLRDADADVKLDIAELHAGGADTKALDLHAVLKDGKANIDPLSADLPGGHLSGNLSIDATQPAPPVHVTLHAPGLALKALLAAAHVPAYATGNLEIYADLHGTGESPHAIAGSLDGSLGLAMAGGSIDNRLLGAMLGKVMESLNLLDLVGKGGASEVKCFGLRMDAHGGVGSLKALALSSSLLTMTGQGTVNLGAETLALAIRPEARVAGTNLVIPVAVSGPILGPSVKVNDLRAAEANAGTVAGAVVGGATPLGIVGGLLGADKLAGGAKADICAPALAAARGQAAPESDAAKPQPATPKPGALLKNLFR